MKMAFPDMLSHVKPCTTDLMKHNNKAKAYKQRVSRLEEWNPDVFFPKPICEWEIVRPKCKWRSNRQYISLNWPGCSPDWWSAWAGWCDRAGRAPPGSGGWTPSCQTYIKHFFQHWFFVSNIKGKMQNQTIWQTLSNSSDTIDNLSS